MSLAEQTGLHGYWLPSRRPIQSFEKHSSLYDNNYLIIEIGLLIILLCADYGGAHPTKTKLIIEFGMIGYKLF